MPPHSVSCFFEITITSFLASCENQYKIDGQNYCFVLGGFVAPSLAQANCEDIGASLPIPYNSAQNEDLRAAIDDMGWGYILIGVTDSG